MRLHLNESHALPAQGDIGWRAAKRIVLHEGIRPDIDPVRIRCMDELTRCAPAMAIGEVLLKGVREHERKGLADAYSRKCMERRYGTGHIIAMAPKRVLDTTVDLMVAIVGMEIALKAAELCLGRWHTLTGLLAAGTELMKISAGACGIAMTAGWIVKSAAGAKHVASQSAKLAERGLIDQSAAADIANGAAHESYVIQSIERFRVWLIRKCGTQD